jgi:hypothetical protein
VIGYFRAAGFADVGVHEFIAGSLSRIAGTRRNDLALAAIPIAGTTTK